MSLLFIIGKQRSPKSSETVEKEVKTSRDKAKELGIFEKRK